MLQVIDPKVCKPLPLSLCVCEGVGLYEVHVHENCTKCLCCMAGFPHSETIHATLLSSQTPLGDRARDWWQLYPETPCKVPAQTQHLAWLYND